MNPPNPSPVCNRGTRHEHAKPATNRDGVRHKGPQIASRSLCARKVLEKHKNRLANGSKGSNGARNAVTKNGVSPPVFEERQGFFIVTFKASLVEGGIFEEGAQKGVQKSTQKSTQKTSDMILAILVENPSATMAQMAEELGIHPSAVKKHLRNLKQQVRLRRIGPDKGGRWDVVS